MRIALSRFSPLLVGFLVLGTSLTFGTVYAIEESTTNGVLYKNERMGISIVYPANWKNSFEGLECMSLTSIGRCLAIFSPEELNFFSITVEYPSNEENPLIKNGCVCKSLLDYVQWHFKTLKSSPGFTFIDDNQVTLPAITQRG
jgi:hypothetical protein